MKATLLKVIGEAGISGARFTEAVERDLVALRDLIQGSLNKLLGLAPGVPGPWTYVVALYVDHVVVERDGKLMDYPFTITGTEVSFGTPTEVVRTFAPASDVLPPAPEAKPDDAKPGNDAALIEALAADPRAYKVRVVRAGQSLNGNFYPDTVLREAAPLFEGCRVFVKSDREHSTNGGKDVRNLIGALGDVVFVEGATPDTGELQARMSLIVGDDDPVAVRLREAVSKGLSHLFGLSIDAKGKAKNVGRVQRATSLNKVNSVDLIVEPGAGGGVISFVEALEDNGDVMNRADLIALIQASNPGLLEGKDVTTLTDAELQEIVKGALKPAENKPEEKTVNVTEAVALQMRMRELVNGSRLPDLAKQKLVGEFTTNVSFTEAVVIDRIKKEIEYLAAANPGGAHVTGLGSISFIEGGSQEDKHDAMLDAFFNPEHKDHRHARSFKECYIALTGDTKITGRLEHSTRFREALNTTAFADVLGNSMTRRLVEVYRMSTDLDMYKLLTGAPVAISDFRTQERVRFGGYGNLPVVAESGPYTALTSPDDEKASYAVSKRGGLETVTLEAIKNDDVGAIRLIPQKLGRAAKRTLAQFVLNFPVANAAIYDTVALFHATHGNLGAAALAGPSFAAARLAMMNQTEATSLEPIGIGPKYLWVPMALEETAYNLFARSTNLDKTFVQTLAPTIVPVPFWTDVTDWMASADVLDIPFMELGFLDGNEEPELFVQDNPTVGSMFSNDQLTWKVRHIYGAGVKEYRGVYKAVVAG